METMAFKTTNLNVFERITGNVWRWWYNVQAKRRAKRQARRMEAYIAKRCEL